MRSTTTLLVLLTLLLLPASPASAQGAPHQAGYLYLSPVPGASYVSEQTRYILVRFEQVTPAQVTNLLTDFITVSATHSGHHFGATRVASDGRTVIFTISADFTTNELVTVTLNPQVEPGAMGQVAPYQYQFMTDAPMPGSLPLVRRALQPLATTPHAAAQSGLRRNSSQNSLGPPAAPTAVRLSNGISVPSDFPQVVVTVNTNPSPGYLFLENGLDGAPPYTMMLDNNGLAVWYRRGRMYDFKIQKNGLITWCLSDVTGFPAFDRNFNYLRTYLTTNGYLTDGHELKVQPDGTYFMIGFRTNTVDMGQYFLGGTPSSVRETVMQEFTTAGDLILQWRAWDNYDIRDENGNTDFPHMNGIDIDEDGNIVVSARHLSEITKINRDSGEVMWRLGGPHRTFTFVNDPFNGTSMQHNISVLGNGHYMVFDNGNYHYPQVSRAVEYQLDLSNLTAALVWQFRDNPDKYADYLGSAQRLPSGDTLINFVLAQYPKAIEVDPHGVKHFELSLVPGADAYRAFRLPWNGVVAAPYLIVEPQADNITLVFNKFGDPDVAYYRIYGGPSPQPSTVVAESSRTLAQLSSLQNGVYYFRVTSVDSHGLESAFSNEESVHVNIFQPGQNMLANGDFSQGTNSWTFTVSGTAAAAWSIQNGVSHISITNGGTSLDDIQLLQGGKPLLVGNQYVLDFDAWAANSRYIDVNVVQNGEPYFNYSGIPPPFLTPNRAHFHYVFTMERPSDFSANLRFNFGTSIGDVYLANVRLFHPAAGDLNLDARVDLFDLNIFTANWLKQGTGLPGDLNRDGKVDFTDFGILGANWGTGGP